MTLHFDQLCNWCGHPHHPPGCTRTIETKTSKRQPCPCKKGTNR